MGEGEPFKQDRPAQETCLISCFCDEQCLRAFKCQWAGGQ